VVIGVNQGLGEAGFRRCNESSCISGLVLPCFMVLGRDCLGALIKTGINHSFQIISNLIFNLYALAKYLLCNKLFLVK